MHERWASQLHHLTSPASQPTKTNDREESKQRNDSENERTWCKASRHRRYIDIKPSMMTAKKAIVEELGVRLWAEDASPASTLSSLRIQFVLAVISEGQTTRLKFALCEVSRCTSCSFWIEIMLTLEMMRLWTNQSAIRNRLLGFRVDFGSRQWIWHPPCFHQRQIEIRHIAGRMHSLTLCYHRGPKLISFVVIISELQWLTASENRFALVTS